MLTPDPESVHDRLNQLVDQLNSLSHELLSMEERAARRRSLTSEYLATLRELQQLDEFEAETADFS